MFFVYASSKKPARTLRRGRAWVLLPKSLTLVNQKLGSYPAGRTRDLRSMPSHLMAPRTTRSVTQGWRSCSRAFTRFPRDSGVSSFNMGTWLHKNGGPSSYRLPTFSVTKCIVTAELVSSPLRKHSRVFSCVKCPCVPAVCGNRPG